MALTVVSETREPDPAAEAPVSQEDLVAAYARLVRIAETGIIPDGPAPQLAPAPPKVVIKRAMPDREILAAMSGLGAVLAVRLMLAVAVVGAWWLAYLAIQTPSIMAISILVAYAVTTVGPLTYLSTKRT